MPPLVLGAGPRRRVGPHISVHCNSGEEDVVFLGDPLEVIVHYIRPTRDEKGRSVRCWGDGCPHCAAEVQCRSNWYAPALVHRRGEVRPTGGPLWERVVYFMPEAAGREILSSGMRSKMFRVWRRKKGAVSCIATQYVGKCVDFSESSFDVLPIVSDTLERDDETQKARNQIQAAFINHAIPATPRLHSETDQQTKFSPEDVRKIREMLRAGGVVSTPLEPTSQPVPISETASQEVLSKGTGEIICGEYSAKMDAIKAKREGGAA